MDRRTKRNGITTSDLDAAWAAIHEENKEATVPAHAKTMVELQVAWGEPGKPLEYSIALRKARKAYKAGKLNCARGVRAGRRIALYWPK